MRARGARCAVSAASSDPAVSQSQVGLSQQCCGEDLERTLVSLSGDHPEPLCVPGPALSSPARPALGHGRGGCARGRRWPFCGAGAAGGGGRGDCSPNRAQEAARGEETSPQAQLEASL